MTDLARWIQEIMRQEEHADTCVFTTEDCDCDQPERAAERLAKVHQESVNAALLVPYYQDGAEDAALAVFERAAKGEK